MTKETEAAHTMSTQLVRRITWIFIPVMLITAYILAKPHAAKPEPKSSLGRMQWTAKANQYIPMTPSPGTTTTAMPGPGDELTVPADTLDASLQVSLRFKPVGNADSAAVSPSGSGTITIRGRKFTFMVDSTSQLMKHALSDGTAYLEGPMEIKVNGANGSVPMTLGVSSLPDTGEGYWSYPNPTGQGIVMFGSPFASPEHAKQIADIQRNRTK